MQGLRELGYVDGRNIRFEYRWAEGKFDRLPELAADLVRLHVDVIVAFVTQATEAAKKQTGTIPIVTVGVSDPIGAGLAASLAHPGGNVTGTSSLAAAVVGKQLELLKLVTPNSAGVAAMFNPANVTFQAQQVNAAKAASEALGLKLRFLEVRAPSNLKVHFRLVQGQKGALLILIDPLFIGNSKTLASICVKSHLITMTGYRTFAEAGALMSYGPNYFETLQSRRAVCGQNTQGNVLPADLPIDQSSGLEFVVNMKTAKMLGLENASVCPTASPVR